MSIPLLLLDADGVFVDLHPVLGKIHGFDLKDWKAGEYDIEKSYNITAKDLWEHEDILHPDFWAELPRTPWADELMDLVLSKYTREQVCFLTMPVVDPNCAAGKMRWFKKHYPKFKFLIGTSKKFCAGPGRKLIDDSDKNIVEFNLHGGHGILFPRIWNSGHMIGDPVGWVRAQLNVT